MLGLAKTSKKFAKSKFEELARLARAFSLLVIEGALESGQVKFGKTDTAVFRTNGGLILTARHAVADARHWITIAAGATEAATGDPDILNRRTADWVFQISAERAEAILSSLETLVIEPKSQGPDPAH